MLLSELAEEFNFNCQCRRLSQKTTNNYQKQIQYLLNYLEQDYGIKELEQVSPQYIKRFLVIMQKKGRKPAYINDLLKAFKCFFKYVHEEGYINTIVTEKIKM